MDDSNFAPTNGALDDRSGLAIIANCNAPYRADFHARLVAGIPELKLHSLFTHGAPDFKWSINVPTSINATYFGLPDDSPTASPFRFPRREWRKGRQLIDYLESHNTRAVICIGYRYLSYLRAIRWCGRAGVPLFYHNDSNIRNERRLSPTRQFGKNLIYAWWMPRVTGIFSMGELGDQFFLKYGARREQLYHVPWTPDYCRYETVDLTALAAFRHKFKLRDDRKYILYSGRLVPVKRVDLLIDAFAAIADSRPEWDLLIVGDGILRSELEARVPERLRNRVVWTGFLQESECAVAYHAAEFLVLPSDVEPWALVVPEALAAGRPVVASDAVGAAYDLVADRTNGGIFPAGDLPALKQCLLEATDGVNIRVYQAQARPALDAWRERINPVAEVRRALVECGVMAAESANKGCQRRNTSANEKCHG
jgi:glycosyltransferase involved in cell wall biosynthesis